MYLSPFYNVSAHVLWMCSLLYTGLFVCLSSAGYEFNTLLNAVCYTKGPILECDVKVHDT